MAPDVSRERQWEKWPFAIECKGDEAHLLGNNSQKTHTRQNVNNILRSRTVYFSSGGGSRTFAAGILKEELAPSFHAMILTLDSFLTMARDPHDKVF